MTDNELVTTLDFDDLLCALSRGESLSKQNKEDLTAYIQRQIQAPKEKRSLEDLYGAYTVVTKSNDKSLAFLLELAFEIPDPLLVSLALETLILKWGIIDNYIERLIQFSLGASYDYDGDVRDVAFECVECILNNHKINSDTKQKLSNLLLHLLNDELSSKDVKDQVKSILANRDKKEVNR